MVLALRIRTAFHSVTFGGSEKKPQHLVPVAYTASEVDLDKICVSAVNRLNSLAHRGPVTMWEHVGTSPRTLLEGGGPSDTASAEMSALSAGFGRSDASC